MRPNNTSSSFTPSAVVDPYDRCFEVFEEARSRYMQFDGVLGVGVGPKERDRQVNPYIPCLIVYVMEKKPLTRIPFDEIIPRTFHGVPTDVVVPGKRQIAAHNAFDTSWLEWDAPDVSFEEVC